jgi:hypothetical protein
MIKIGDKSFSVFSEFTLRGFVFSAYFIIYWLCIWYIADFFNKRIQRKQQILKPNKGSNILLLFSFNIIFGFSASWLSNHLYHIGDIRFFGNEADWIDVTSLNPELTMSLLMMYMMVFAFDVYYRFSIKAKEDQIQLEKLKRENAIAQYLNLRSQIEPHFLFNSLSVLSSIIYEDVNLASEFILRLSRMLRYVIEKNEFMLVRLKDEIAFTEDYLFLIKTRFEEGILFENNVNKSILNTSYIPPATLQLLIENAIKHNKFTKEQPLRIKILNKDDTLVITNNINRRKDFQNSTKQGLDNLVRRYSHLSDHPVVINQTENEFKVVIPILTVEHYESLNIRG